MRLCLVATMRRGRISMAMPNLPIGQNWSRLSDTQKIDALRDAVDQLYDTLLVTAQELNTKQIQATQKAAERLNRLEAQIEGILRQRAGDSQAGQSPPS